MGSMSVGDRRSATDIVGWTHVDKELIMGFDLAHSLEAAIAHPIKNRLDLTPIAPYVLSAKGTNSVPSARCRS